MVFIVHLMKAKHGLDSIQTSKCLVILIVLKGIQDALADFIWAQAL